MARLPFAGTANDYVFSTYTLGSSKLVSLTGATLTFYDAETGGNQVTDLTDEGGAAIDSVTVPATGDIPRFYGPNGVSELWVSANGSTNRTRIVTAQIDSTDDAVSTLAGDPASQLRIVLDGEYASSGRTVNGHALTGDVTLAAGDVGAVPTTRKVNGKALSADVTLTPADTGAQPAASLEGDVAGKIGKGGALDSALSTAYAAKAGQVLIPLGDSITAHDAEGSSAVYNIGTNSAGWVAVANALLGKPFRVPYNAGVAGQRTDQILARIDTDVLAKRPQWVTVLAGTNDLLQTIAEATITGNLQAIYTKLLNAGKRVVACTIPPVDSLATADQQKRRRINQWIATTARNTPGMVLVDWSRWVENVSTGGWASGLSADGTHPNTAGGWRMGKVMADTLAPLLPKQNGVMTGGNDAANLCTHPLFDGAGGQKDASVTGTVASGWAVWLQTGTGNAAASVVARTDGPQGNLQRVVINSGSTGTYFLQQQLAVTGVNVGDWIYGEIELNLSGDTVNLSRLYGALNFAASGQPTVLTSFDLRQVSADPAIGYPISRTGIVLRTTPIQVPATPTLTAIQLQCYFKADSGTFDFLAGAVRKASDGTPV